MTSSVVSAVTIWLLSSICLNAFGQASVNESSSKDYIKFYQKFISGIRGQDCPMYPSCSNFAQGSFQSKSFSTAFVLTADRLVRCGHDLKEYDVTLQPTGFKWLDVPGQNNSPKELRFLSDRSYFAYADTLRDADSSIVFIKSLVNNGFYTEALLEIKRYEFYKSFNKEVFINELLCLKTLNEHEKAIYSFETKCPDFFKKDPDILYQLATVYFKIENYKKSLQVVDTALDNATAGQNRAQLFALQGLLYTSQHQWNNAKLSFTNLSGLPYRPDVAQANVRLVERVQKLKYKKPVLASLLSVIPGAGYAYIGNSQTAVSSLLLNGVFAYATFSSIKRKNYGVAALTGLFSVSFYIANIYGAGQGAKRHNEQQQKNVINNLINNINP